MYQYENKIIQKNRDFIAYSAIKTPNKPPRHNPLLTSAKLSPKKLFPIIGESLNNLYPRTCEKQPFFNGVRKSRAPENGNAAFA